MDPEPASTLLPEKNSGGAAGARSGLKITAIHIGTGRTHALVKRREWILAVGIASILAGLGIIFWPREMVSEVAILFASALIAAGLLRLLAAFADPDGSQDGEVRLLVLASTELGLGIYLLLNSTASLVSPMIMVIVYWLTGGFIELTEVDRTGQWTARAWVLTSRTVVLVVGAALTIFLLLPKDSFLPGESLALLRWQLGSWLISYGFLLIPRGAWRSAKARRSS